MQRTLSTLLPALALILALGEARDAAAQQTIPEIVAEAWPTPVGAYASFRVHMKNATEQVVGGALDIHYRITCTLNKNQACPGIVARTARAVIPCGESEGGVDCPQHQRTALQEPHPLLHAHPGDSEDRV